MAVINKREYCVEDSFDGSVRCYKGEPFWATSAGFAIRLVIFLLVLLLALYIFGGYLHAKARLRRGLPLLKYHRWMIPRAYRNPNRAAPQNHFTFYEMNNHQTSDPPPVYSNDAPPQYYPPPPGASKMAPSQHVEQVPSGVPPPPTTGYTAAPPPPPPPAGRPNVDVEQNQGEMPLPARPPPSRTALFDGLRVTRILGRRN